MRVLGAFVRRDYLIHRSYRLAFALELVTGGMSLLVYYFISRTFGDAAPASLGGAPSYFAFAAVGIALLVVLQSAVAYVAGALREEQLTGTLEASLAQPLRASEMAFGLTAYPFALAGARAVLYLAVAGLLLGADFGDADWLGVIVSTIAAMLPMLAIGVALGSAALLLKRSEFLGGIALFSLGLLGGAFFPVSVLPGWLETLANAAPTKYAYDAMRSAFFRGEDWAGPTLVLVAMGALALPAALWSFDRAVQFARRRASLNQY